MGIGFKVFKRAAAILGSFVGVVILATIALFWWSADQMCRNVEIAETPIAGTKYKVVVFQRDCGATTGFSTQASIINLSSKLKNNSGNIFTADTNHGAAPSGPGGGPEVRVRVLGPQQIELSYHKNTRVFDAKEQYQGIRIVYSRW